MVGPKTPGIKDAWIFPGLRGYVPEASQEPVFSSECAEIEHARPAELHSVAQVYAN